MCHRGGLWGPRIDGDRRPSLQMLLYHRPRSGLLGLQPHNSWHDGAMWFLTVRAERSHGGHGHKQIRGLLDISALYFSILLWRFVSTRVRVCTNLANEAIIRRRLPLPGCSHSESKTECICIDAWVGDVTSNVNNTPDSVSNA